MNWKERILHHQETPPEAAWEGIASFLDEAAAHSIQNKMHQASVEAPAEVWDAISRKLDRSEKPVQRIPAIWLRAAASLMFLLLSALAIRFWLSQPSGVVPATTSAPIAMPGISIPDPAKKPSIPLPDSSPASVAVHQQPASMKKQWGNADSIPDIPPMLLPSFIDQARDLPDPIITVQRIPLPEESTSNTYVIQERKDGYLQITGPDGSSFRISRKFESLFQPGTRETDPNKEEFIDRIIRDSKKWNELFYKWRQEMMLQTIGTDPLNLLHTVENQETPAP